MNVTQSKRIGINHITSFTPIQFVSLMESLNAIGGTLNINNCKITKKIDGSSMKFGFNPSNNNFFVESSYMGPFYNTGDFFNYVHNKFNSAYPQIFGFEYFLNSLNNSYLHEIFSETYGFTKIFTEFLYNPAGKVKNNNIIFVRIPYSLTKLGRIATIYILRIEDENRNIHPKSDSIIENLHMFLGSSGLKIFNIETYEENVSLKDTVDWFYSGWRPEYIDILKSRKNIDKKMKTTIKNFIALIQKNMHETILNSNVGSWVNNDEGLVFELKDGPKFKVITNYWKGLDEWEEI